MTKSGSVVRLLMVNWALGILLGFAFATLVLVFDLGGIWSLASRSDFALIAFGLLYGGFAVTCGGVVCASAVMRLPVEENDPTPGLPAIAEPSLAHVRRKGL